MIEDVDYQLLSIRLSLFVVPEILFWPRWTSTASLVNSRDWVALSLREIPQPSSIDSEPAYFWAHI